MDKTCQHNEDVNLTAIDKLWKKSKYIFITVLNHRHNDFLKINLSKRENTEVFIHLFIPLHQNNLKPLDIDSTSDQRQLFVGHFSLLVPM